MLANDLISEVMTCQYFPWGVDKIRTSGQYHENKEIRGINKLVFHIL